MAALVADFTPLNDHKNSEPDCFGLFKPHQHGIASKQAKVPKTNISDGKSAMLVGGGYKDELKCACM